MNKKANSTPQERKSAQRSIDFIVAKHSLNSYRKLSADEFSDQAKYLVQRLQIVHLGDVARVVGSLRSVADDVARFELDDGSADGHHERAAEAYRRAADEFDADGCPWRDLRHLLPSVLGQLADALWAANNRHSDEWAADQDVVGTRVWGDELVTPGRLRRAVQRLGEWLNQKGVIIKFHVNSRAQRPRIECRVVAVDSEMIAEAVARHQPDYAASRRQ